MTDEPIETPREALERALWLAVTAPDRERMLRAGKIALEISRTLPEEDVLSAMEAIEGRLDTMERKAFGNVVSELKLN